MSEGKKYSKEDYTARRYKWIYKRGRSFLMEYLSEISEGLFADEQGPLQKRYLFRVIGDEYKRLMTEDEAFYREVEAFCSKRRFKNEKRDFCKNIFTRMVTSGEIHRNYSKKTIEIDALPEYIVPEHHRN